MADRKVRILGQMMGQFVGKDVIVVGHATKIGAGGKSLELTTFDKTKINVSLPDTIEAKPNDILEVWGTVKSKATMVATQCVIFEEEHNKDFDQKAYNNLLVILHAISDRKWKLNDSKEALH